MAHALRKYARHVQKTLQEKLPKRPPYQWCLAMVQRFYDEVRENTVDARPRSQAIKDQLAERILPIGALHLQVEGKFRYPSFTQDPPSS